MLGAGVSTVVAFTTSEPIVVSLPHPSHVSTSTPGLWHFGLRAGASAVIILSHPEIVERSTCDLKAFPYTKTPHTLVKILVFFFCPRTSRVNRKIYIKF